MQPTGSHAQPRTTRRHQDRRRQARPPGRGQKQTRGKAAEEETGATVRNNSRPIRIDRLRTRVMTIAAVNRSHKEAVICCGILLARMGIYESYQRQGQFTSAEEIQQDLCTMSDVLGNLKNGNIRTLQEFRQALPADFLPTHRNVVRDLLDSLVVIVQGMTARSANDQILETTSEDLRRARTPALWAELTSPDHLYTVFAKVAAG